MKIFLKEFYVCVVCLLLFVQCGNKRKTSVASVGKDTVAVVSEAIDTLPPLQEGEVFYKDDEPFGEVIELKGRHITGDTAIFPIMRTNRLLVKKNMLLKAGDHQQMWLFKLPEMKALKAMGRKGSGPNEYLYPKLIETEDTTAFCYVVDGAKYGNFLKLTSDYQWKVLSSPFKGETAHTLDWIHQVGDHKYVGAKQSRKGMHISEWELMGDSIAKRDICLLNLRKDQKFWGAYLGALGVNASKNRMVYAYKFYRTLKFMDLEGKYVRTITFKGKKEYDDGTEFIANGLDNNITHYWFLCSGKDYVYLFYQGKTPPEQYKAHMKGNYESYMEKYDWNGNPICKYKLDQYGRWAVDEVKKKLYLMTDYHDEPFFVYDLP